MTSDLLLDIVCATSAENIFKLIRFCGFCDQVDAKLYSSMIFQVGTRDLISYE